MIISSSILIQFCLLFDNFSNSKCAKNSFVWPFNLFRKKIEYYDKEIENKAKFTTEEWIKKANFPCETYKVTTEDGYILVLHRIPKQGQQPVLLVHGFMTSSLSFVMLGPENSLAFQLASNDFDVWLINTRGSIPSRNHTTLTVKEPLFWEYSFHEIGLYDISASLDFIRNTTAFQQTIFIGHSQGASALFVLCSLRPEYNDRILLMQALAPVVFLKNYSKTSKETLKTVKQFLKEKVKSKSFELIPRGWLLRKCSIRSENAAECLELMSDIFGSGQYNQSLDPIVLGAAFAGGSLQEIKHFMQILKSGDFVGFDRGLEGNRQYYNSVEPPYYNLSKITFPVILHYSSSDSIATESAVQQLYKVLESTIGVYAIPVSKFNHLDFIWSSSLRTLLNSNVVKLCEDFLKGTLNYRIE